MSFIALLGQATTHYQHPSSPPRIKTTPNDFIFINNIFISTKNSNVVPHGNREHASPYIENMTQNYVFINNLEITIIGDSANCGATVIPDPQTKKTLQQFITITP